MGNLVLSVHNIWSNRVGVRAILVDVGNVYELVMHCKLRAFPKGYLIQSIKLTCGLTVYLL